MATQTRQVVWRDRQFGAAIAAAPVSWALVWWWSVPGIDLTWPLYAPLPFLLSALVYPLLEEIVFRGGLQPLLLDRPRMAQRWYGISGANLLASVVFSMLHLFAHAPIWALAVLAPSLVFGYFRERHDSLKSPIALHVLYNAGYFWLFGAQGVAMTSLW